MMNIISLGAGVQSSTMALMAAHGEIMPMPDCAIFADTQAEPTRVYQWLDWLETKLPYPVYRVTKGDLAKDALKIRVSKKTGMKYLKPMIPAYTLDGTGRRGMYQRHCTMDYKVAPIRKKIKELYGKASVSQWIGISRDENARMKESNVSNIVNRWPLIELTMTRYDCELWMVNHYSRKPPRSACYFCPFHNDLEWDVHFLAEAIDFEKNYQAAVAQIDRLDGVPFLHASRIPLGEVVFTAKAQLNLFENECEGMCNT